MGSSLLSLGSSSLGMRLASKLITAIVKVSGGMPIIALFLTMICCIILGMGVPTTANFCIMASTCAPILMDKARRHENAEQRVDGPVQIAVQGRGDAEQAD